MNGYLELADGAFVGVRDGLVLGRVAGCDIVVDDNKASRRHARLIVEAGVVEIEDLQSSNGTLLNGHPVERRLLRDGDEVRIGKTVIVYREGPLPGINAHGHRSAPAVFDDDDDLLGGNDLSATPSPAPVKAPIEPPPRPASPVPPRAGVPPPAAPPAPPPAPAPAPAPARGSVVEFEDEVVEVRKAPAPVAAPSAAVGKSKPAARPDEVVASSQRVLQFSKQAGGGGLLGDDLAQMSGGMRALLVLGVIAVGAAIVWGIMTAMR